MSAISVRQLGKKFKLFSSTGGRFLEYLSGGILVRHTDFWALQDITFDLPAGETLGILGQNGSGKSTLLSILAGVLEPSAGIFTINGKVAAILELGSGFHPEFSGRDNVFMYGSIMGLSKQEIDERFEDIVRFSELGDFIDQPLRTYSSGMIVRLAFSVAVNVNADILIVDEALAVGDAIFQHRCFQKIRDLQQAGKTILYVGHDTEAVRNLCSSALLLDNGRIIESGDPNTIVNRYHALIAERERSYHERTLIEHGETRLEGYETVYDLSANLSEAVIRSAPGIPVESQTVEIQFTPRRIIFAHPPSVIFWQVSVQPESSLAFAIGILPDAKDMITQGVRFDIDVKDGNETETIFSRILHPKRNIGDSGWHNFLIPLGKYSGKTISLVLKTSGSGRNLDFCWSAWGWVKIVRPIESSIEQSSGMVVTLREGQSHKIPLSSKEEPTGQKKAEIFLVELMDDNFRIQSTFHSGDIALLGFHIRFLSQVSCNSTAGLIIRNKFQDIYATNTRRNSRDIPPKQGGEIVSVVFKFRIRLGSGLYSITPAIAIVHKEGVVFDPADVEILDSLEERVWMNVIHDMNTGLVDLEAEVEIDEDAKLTTSQIS